MEDSISGLITVCRRAGLQHSIQTSVRDG